MSKANEKLLTAALAGMFAAVLVVEPTDNQLREILAHWLTMCRKRLRGRDEGTVVRWAGQELVRVHLKMKTDDDSAMQRLAIRLERLGLLQNIAELN
jgi:hypothetical protein